MLIYFAGDIVSSPVGGHRTVLGLCVSTQELWHPFMTMSRDSLKHYSLGPPPHRLLGSWFVLYSSCYDQSNALFSCQIYDISCTDGAGVFTIGDIN